MRIPKEVLEHVANYKAFLCYSCEERVTFASQGEEIWANWSELVEEMDENSKLPIEEQRQITFRIVLKCNACEEEWDREVMPNIDPSVVDLLQNLPKNDATEEEVGHAKAKIRALEVMRDAAKDSERYE